MSRVFMVLVLTAASLAGCGGSAPKGATESASRLLAAAYQNDRVAFEAEIDRGAVREDVRRQVTEMAREASLEVEGGPSEFALDRMISPDAIRLVGAEGRRLDSPPTVEAVAPLMRKTDGGRVCLSDGTESPDCLLTFARENKTWRLVGMKAMDLRIELAGAGD